ncbi:EamA family transporter [Paenibacillus sp. D2_2]|uniref:EamA family transporter n=1 Tax=Paenibacillus sp. D2_2 TaxID=3073092 RepID=UPI00281625C8|nr:EamA family transporter [Paenibacillus sp. D2_2]WMT39560.1 EamA family transporter [Paenibacillus sp. D2_2]
MRKYAGELGLLLVAVIWGTGFIASAISLDFLSPYQVMAIRFLIAFCLMTLIFMKHLRALTRRCL